MNDLDKLDVRLHSKDESMRRLWQAEFVYLMSRGWIPLYGIEDKFLVAPGDDYKSPDIALHSHEEALKIQKEKDKADV